MDDEDDSYGFGSFADLFDDAALPAPAKPLDARAMSRLWASEHAVAEFELRWRAGGAPREFAHVAARFEGASVDGGLGSAFFVDAWDGKRGGGLLWLQPRQSDATNVQEQRKKELQDITNQRTATGDRSSHSDEKSASAKSAAAVFIASADVAEATAKKVQNVARGIALKLRSGPTFELVCMPGPFAKASDCDELLAVIAQSTGHAAPGGVASARTPPQAAPGTDDLVSSAQAVATPRSPSAATPASSSGLTRPQAPNNDAALARERVREMIRTYLSLDALSDEATELARKVHSLSGYHLGPMATNVPLFASDPAYKKRTVVQLTQFLDRMNHEWKRAEKDRERVTGAKAMRTQSDGFEYTDVATGERIPPQAYQETYRRRMGCIIDEDFYKRAALTIDEAKQRARDRRRSIVAPGSLASWRESLRSSVSPGDAARIRSKIPTLTSGPKRRRGDEAAEGSAAKPSGSAFTLLGVRKKARRQSIVGDVRIDLAGGDEQGAAGDSERVAVRMDPCGHSVCGTCWKRLAPATTGDSVARFLISIYAHADENQERNSAQLRSSTVRMRSEALREAHEKELAQLLFAASRQLPRQQIAAAAERNFNVAKAIEWRRQRLHTRSERLQLDKESDACTFRPARIAKDAKHATVQPRYLLPATTSTLGTPEPKTTAAASRERQRSKRGNGCNTIERSVFDRLSETTRTTTQNAGRDAASAPPRAALPADQLARFVERQAHDEAKRAEHRRTLETKFAPPFAPTLSLRTREIGAELRGRSLDDILHRESERRQRKLEACIGHLAMIQALVLQEQRMRTLELGTAA
ncbi:hypothetical protein PybrP1_004291 [[Pythium] brassicae (nom. inval.)]|nr:hypothetical protein PybrP1_004291 [[Pythium] brassicae (nom. inval.)]